MAGADSLGHCGLFDGLCGLVQAFLLPRRGRPSGGVLANKNGRTGSPPWDAGISSDATVAWALRFNAREEDSPPVAPAVRADLRSSSDEPPVSRTSSAQHNGDEDDGDDDDDDCVILDGDPHSAVAVEGETVAGAGDGGSDDELQIVAAKGKVACRDFPHSRHLCSNMPFGTTSHEKHCTMCYCFVCDAPAPCSYWGRALSVHDHCHATDKETKWKTLRQAFKCRNLPETEISRPLALAAGVSRAYSATSNSFLRLDASSSATRVQSGTSSDHRAQVTRIVDRIVNAPSPHPQAGAGRGTSNAQTARPIASSATRVQSGTSSGHTAQVTRLVEPTVSAPRPHPAAGAGRGTSNAQTAQISHQLWLTLSAPRASSATRVQGGTSDGHSAQVTRLVQPTVSTPRSHPAAGAGRGSRPVEPTVSAARPYSAAITGRGTSNTQTSQITRPVEPTVSATRGYPAERTGRGISNAHTAPVTLPVEQTVSAPRVYPAGRAGSDSSNAHSGQITYPATATRDVPEGATVYVRNLPDHIDNERLRLTFQQAGVVLFSKVIYDRETRKSRGFGYVTMSTVQEAETAVRIYHGSEVYGRRLTVKIAPPRGAPRVGQVDTTRRQSGSPLKIFVCNLPSQVDRSRLEELFSKHGTVVDARVIYELREGASCSRGFGFVTMATEEESYKAIHALNKQILEGHALVVKVATERPQQGQNAASQSRNTHTGGRASLNVAPTVSAPRAYPATRATSGTSNAYTVQVTRGVDPTRSN